MREELTRIAETLTGERIADPVGSGTPAGAADAPAGPPGPAGSARLRRVARAGLRAAAPAAVLAVVAGFGWMVAQSGHGTTSRADTSGRSDHSAASQAAGAAGRPAEPERVLACSRLVVEGTVAGVEPRRGTGRVRIVLTVRRSYVPAHGPARVALLLDGGAGPVPRTGRHVLVGVGRGNGPRTCGRPATPGWPPCAWITEALPGARHPAGPSGEPPGTP
ncbi:hypothetical protein QQY24_20625 [Streptomyces sp. TG1A-8]|uniref:hypothetical protein n=1 Tax=Streptomyces sp. TG1A-8 TaxID=3051385 RepID=UPI00265C5DB1|nr:hypothetical protein [Streptomyces sp. TG1A-8]MDO0927695.1 hypothetical protein [Streptomyces sp. TG1A-8]